MESDNAQSQAQDFLQAAMSGLARTDPELQGARVTRWYVVTEHEPTGEGGRVLSIFRSPDLKPWDALGFLDFAKTIEQRDVTFGPGGLEDDDQE